MKEKIFFIGFFAFIANVASLGGGLASAATRILQPEVKFDIQIAADPGVNTINPAIDFERFNVKFDVGRVFEGDKFTFSTHGLPIMDSRDIFDISGTKIIGKMEKEREIAGSVDKQYSGENFAELKPGDFNIAEYRVVFNKTAEEFHDISFSINNQRIQTKYTMANQDYSGRIWAKVNEDEKFSKDITVLKYSKTAIKNSLWNSGNNLEVERDEFMFGTGIITETDMTGALIEITLPEDLGIKFAQKHRYFYSYQNSNFTYTDASEVNQHGVIKASQNSGWSPEIVSQTDKKVVIRVKSQDSNTLSSSIGWLNYEVDDAIRTQISETGKMPNFNIGYKLIKDGRVIIDSTDKAVDLNILGSVAQFKTKEDDKSSSSVRIDIDTTKKIKAPSTGRENTDFSAVIVSGVLVLATTSVAILNKK